MKLLFRPLLLGIFLFASASMTSAEPVKFSDALYKKFQHPRCLQCHQFNSRVNNGRAYNSHRARYLCDNCHTNRITGLPRGEWMAPNEKMDWTGMGARDLCLLIKQIARQIDRALARHADTQKNRQQFRVGQGRCAAFQ